METNNNKMPPQQELNVQIMQNMQEKNDYDELNLRDLYKRKVEETVDKIHKIRKEMHLIGRSIGVCDDYEISESETTINRLKIIKFCIYLISKEVADKKDYDMKKYVEKLNNTYERLLKSVAYYEVLDLKYSPIPSFDEERIIEGGVYFSEDLQMLREIYFYYKDFEYFFNRAKNFLEKSVKENRDAFKLILKKFSLERLIDLINANRVIVICKEFHDKYYGVYFKEAVEEFEKSIPKRAYSKYKPLS